MGNFFLLMFSHGSATVTGRPTMGYNPSTRFAGKQEWLLAHGWRQTVSSHLTTAFYSSGFSEKSSRGPDTDSPSTWPLR